MMDENAKLSEIRKLVQEIRDAGAVGEPTGIRLQARFGNALAAAVEELDEYLSDNGMLPLAWLPPEAIKGGTAGLCPPTAKPCNGTINSKKG